MPARIGRKIGLSPSRVKNNRCAELTEWMRSATLRDFARANLAHFKAPHSVTFVKELPKLRPTFTSSLFANLNQD